MEAVAPHRSHHTGKRERESTQNISGGRMTRSVKERKNGQYNVKSFTRLFIAAFETVNLFSVLPWWPLVSLDLHLV